MFNKLIIALAILVATSVSYSEISVTPAVGYINVNYNNGFYDYSASGISVDITVASDNGYYFNAEVTDNDSEDYSRGTTTLTVGKSFNSLGMVAFIGLRNASSPGPEPTQDSPGVHYEINGGFFG